MADVGAAVVSLLLASAAAKEGGPLVSNFVKNASSPTPVMLVQRSPADAEIDALA